MFFRHRNLERKEKGSLPRRKKTEGERASLSPFQKAVKASMTIEMACVLPMFLLCMAGFLMFGNGLLEAISAQTRLANQVKEEAVAAAVEACKGMGWGSTSEEMASGEAVTSFQALFWIGDFIWIQQFRVRIWTGRDPAWGFGWNGEGEESDKRMVYVTVNGEVYHIDPKCTHIHLSIHSVQNEELKELRNENGEKYHACEYCGGGTGTVYITDSGNRYHHSLECSGLKRTVMQIPLTELGGLRPCSRCFENGE